MRAVLFAIVLTCLTAWNNGAFAAEGADGAKQTDAVTIALLQRKMAGVRPDFEDWVTNSQQYYDTPVADRFAMRDREIKNLSDTFDLLTPGDPIFIHTVVPLSEYDSAKKAFLVDRFHELSFYTYVYKKHLYAVIPHKIEEYRWLKVSPDLGNTVWKETDEGRHAHIRLTLLPYLAEAKAVSIGKQHYYLLMTNVLKVELWSKDETRLLWNDTMNQPKGLKRLLMQLYQ